jgi:hypothetical protein
MSSTAIADIAIGIVVVALLVTRQMRTRRVRENSAARFVLILTVIGLAETYSAAKGHSIGGATIAWVLGSLVVAGALGALRATTVKLWRGEDGAAWQHGTALTAALWIVAIAAHFAIEIGINHSTIIANFGASTIFLYLAVTLGAQREVVRLRAAALAPAARPPAELQLPH